jgi:extradiol dioxygenase family protein
MSKNPTTSMNVFHYAFKVRDLESTRRFYIELLGCEAGRSSDTWLDFNFFGHQLSAHLSKDIPALDYCGQVDQVKVPIPHFGCLLDTETFLSLQKKFEDAGVHFVVQAQKRYAGNVGEQYTMFVLDYSGNPLEFKTFTNPNEIFSV